MEKKKLYDLVGIACLVILLFVLIFSHVQANKSQKLDLPADAQTLTASADGKVGPVEVEVIANQSEIFKVRVTNHTETDGIGTNAVDQIPGAIVEQQSLAVDAVSGATITSEAIQKAVAEAMTSGGIDPSAFGYAAAEEEPAEVPETDEAPAPAEAPAAESGAGYVPGTYTGEGTGMGKVVVNVTVDDSSITAVEIDGSGETPEIGGAALGTLTDQVMAAQGASIDGVAGASLTSAAVRTAVAAALEQAAASESSAAPAESEETAAAEASAAEGAGYVPGTYTAEAQGMGKVVVNVTVDESSITAVEIDGSGETPGIGAAAVDPLKEQVLAAQGAAIDGVAGATITSTAVRTAVEAALAEASAGAGAAAADEAAEPAAEAPAAAAAAPEGTVTETGSGQGIDGPVVVQVTADAETIYSVEVLEQNETPGIGSVAVEKLPGAIVEANSLLVDGISGATVTSTAIKTAVTEALTKAGFDAAAFEKELTAAGPVEKTEETLEYDVVVVGAGGAGLTAAVRATQEGAKVLVLEKMPMVGGNSNRAEGGMNAAGTKLEAELGLEDSTVENFTADTLRLGHDLANPDLVRTLAENSSDAIDWLGSIGAPFTDVHATGGCEGRKYLHQPEGGRAVGEYLVEKLSAVAEEQGIEIMLNTKATEILMEDGKAVGVKAEDDATVYTVKAKAVVLATGGFGANFELMASYDPSLANAVTTNHSGATGDGIMMAQAIGADTVDMEQIQLHPTVIQENGLLVSESLRSKGAIIVNTEGKRFVNDLAGRDVVSQAELKQPDGYCFIIFDQNLVDGLALAEKFIDRGYAIRGETYEELAENMGLSAEAVKNFAQTMETWNAAVAADEDKEFGRKGMTDDLSTAPFYAIKIAPGIHHTMGGIKINTEAQVIDTDGNVIPGLYAAGETTGGIHGGNRVGGNAVCDFVVFGRISGTNAAAYANGGEVTMAPAEEAAAAAAPDGTVTETGSGQGIGGPVVVQVTADAEKIYSVEVLEQNETVGIGSVAVERLPGAIMDANSLLVDGISGATVTSTAIKTAVTEALTKAGLDAAAFEREPGSESEPAEGDTSTSATYEADVVVIGAGGAGMTAAITAHDEGKTVLVLESQGMVGGNSVRSTGGMNAAPTEWQQTNEFAESAGVESTLKKVANYPDNERIQELGAIVAEQWAAYQEKPEGYFDSAELFQLDTLIGGGGMNDPSLVKKLVENSESAIAWLDQLDPEIILHNVAQFGGASVKRIHRPVDDEGKTLSVGAYVVPLLQKNLEARGIELLLETKATEILTDDSGAAIGVVAETKDGGSITVNAKAVVIASGGFGANNDMIASIRPELDGFITTNAPGIQGQGIQMAQAVGADTVDLEQIQLHPTVHVEGTSAVLITEGLRGDGAILVNQEGERFFDEVSTRDKVSAAEFEQTGGYAWLIVDSRMSDASNVIQGYINKGYAQTGETFEELAAAIGAPADTFTATMEKWNACVAAKEDAEFGRVSFANPLDQAPYYAIKVQPGIHHTMGGIKINDNAQVINTEGNVIPGLFAAGEVTGGVHGNNRLGGNAVADFTIFGRIAGSSASAYAGGETAPSDKAAPAEESNGMYVPGTYTAEATGMGKVVVSVTVNENSITAIEIDGSGETPGIGAAAVEPLQEQVMAAQSAEIDGVAGATITSNAVRSAVEAALAEAMAA